MKTIARSKSIAAFELFELYGRDFNYIIHGGSKLHERASKKVYLLKKFAKKVKDKKLCLGEYELRLTPVLLSAKFPAPTIGESPIRPCSFPQRPENPAQNMNIFSSRFSKVLISSMHCSLYFLQCY